MSVRFPHGSSGYPQGVDLSLLYEALVTQSPVATVYADLREPVLERDSIVAARYEADLRGLTASGCPDSVVGMVREGLSSVVGTSESGLIIASQDGILAQVPLDREVPTGATWGHPWLTPLILHTPEPMSALVVLVDSRQAQIHILRDGLSASRVAMINANQRGHAMTMVEQIIAPADLYTRKTAAAGWFGFDQKQRDHGVENAWLTHSRSVAHAVSLRLSQTPVDMIAIAGETRHRSAIMDVLGERTSVPIHSIDGGGLAPWLSVSAVRDAVLVEMAVHRTARRGRVLEAWQEGMHPRHGTARQGIVTTLGAIREQRVSALLLTRDAPIDARGVVGDQPWLVGMDAAEIDAYAPTTLRTGPMIDLAIRAVALGHGDVHAMTVLPPAAQGMAALLRWS